MKDFLSEGVHTIFRGKSNITEEMLLIKIFFHFGQTCKLYTFVYRKKMLVIVTVNIQLWIKICGNKYF